MTPSGGVERRRGTKGPRGRASPGCFTALSGNLTECSRKSPWGLDYLPNTYDNVSCERSVVLYFFAGSAVTTRVAMELGRYSLSSDLSPDILDYFAKHMENWQEPDLFGDRIPYRLLGPSALNDHPVFGTDAKVSAAAGVLSCGKDSL